MTQNEFLKFITLTMPDLYRKVYGMTPHQGMRFKYDLQKAISTYSKGKNGQLDAIQEKALAMMMKLEKWIKHSFIEKELRILNRTMPRLTDEGRKSAARAAWEVYNSTMSY